MSAFAPESEQVRDAANRIVSAARHYREHPGANLRQGTQASYAEDVNDALGWIQN
ncbi:MULTISPECIES: hypothetical protein [Streptomyces]|uniref:hypothetical protein n=1 Tax=Streptomyces TaxID=1883 RepID=UPI000A87139D|nr:MULTISPECIES: hypothetical protein [Streptomyces]